MVQPLGLATLLCAVWVCTSGPTFTWRYHRYGPTGPTGVNVLTAESNSTGERVTILTSLGGGLNELFLRSQKEGRLRDVLANHGDNYTAMHANADWRGRILLPYANRIAGATYVFRNRRYWLPLNEPARNNSLHGLLFNRSMDVVSTTSEGSTATATLAFTFPSIDRGYPWRVGVEVVYTITSQDRFTVTVSVTNHEQWPVPYFNSMHPYFNVHRISEAVVEFEPCVEWNHLEVTNHSNLYSNMIPTGAVTPKRKGWLDGSTPIGGTPSLPTYYDDEFKIARNDQCPPSHGIRLRVYDPHTDQTGVLWADADFRYAQIFTGAWKIGRFNAIALEAMSGMADAYNNHDGLKIISGGETHTNTVHIYVEDGRLP